VEANGCHSVLATSEKKCPNAKLAIHTSNEPLPHYKKKEKKDSTLNIDLLCKMESLNLLARKTRLKGFDIVDFCFCVPPHRFFIFSKNAEPWMECDGLGNK